MPRKSEGRHRLEVLLTEEQYQVLLRQAEVEGYIILDGSSVAEGSPGSLAEWLRDHLFWTVRGFDAATPLTARGKYPRKQVDKS